MLFIQLFKNLRILPLLALPLLAWFLPSDTKEAGVFTPDKVNLALRRTADGLLRASGDSTSRIPAIEQRNENVWRVRLEESFQYEQLPALLENSLQQFGIRRPYEVAVRRCFDETIDLGYLQLDVIENNTVPCAGREKPEGCHYLEVTFLEKSGSWPLNPWKTGALLFVLGGLAGYWFFNRKKTTLAAPTNTPAAEVEWLDFGNSRLDVAGQILLCAGGRETLTFRETKLLRLFVTSPDRLLERDVILQQVWADEGVLVGRSVDVFVSRLRKKLAADTSVGIVAVHGVGYRLETGKAGKNGKAQ